MLGMAGHQVRMARDAAGLRRQLARQPADLIVLDLTLPDEDGLAVARWLRTLAVEPGIVMLTGLGDSIDRVAGLEAGADDYMAKPFEPRELTARVEAVLRRLD
ncbi:MAG: response regulator, partial [Geminicoccaceae bacterium]